MDCVVVGVDGEVYCCRAGVQEAQVVGGDCAGEEEEGF